MNLLGMEENRKNNRQIVIGYDLGEQFAQISYCFMDKQIPETYSVSAVDEQYNIPLCLCKRRDVNQWFFGWEAVRKAEEGTFISDLYARACRNEQVMVEGKQVEYSELLGLFVKKCFGLLGFIIGTASVESIVVTMPKLDDEVFALMNQVMEGIHVDKQKISFRSHVESLFYYTVNQPAELWSYQVGVFDFSGKYLKSYRVEMNRKTKPVVTFVHEKEYPDVCSRDSFATEKERQEYYQYLEQEFLRICEEFVQGHILTSIHLIGVGFNGEWYKEILKFLCRGRRVFGGNNLYSKGACYCAREICQKTELSEEYIFLGRDKLKANIGIWVTDRGQECYYPLMDGGISWFDAKAELEFMLDEGDSIPLLITPLDGKNAREVKIQITGIAKRPRRTTRLHMGLTMLTPGTVSVKITDLGFFRKTEKEPAVWEEVVRI